MISKIVSPYLFWFIFAKEQYCTSFFNQLKNIGGAVIGNLLTPLLFGKILYTPKTTFTFNLIKKVFYFLFEIKKNTLTWLWTCIWNEKKFNETFQQFDHLNEVLSAFSNALDQFDDLRRLTANLSVNLQYFNFTLIFNFNLPSHWKTLLDNPFYQDAIQLFLLQDSSLTFSDIKFFLSTLQNITSLSSNWSNINSMVNDIRKPFSCFEVNRFIEVQSEDELEKQAASLFANGTFLIGIVFENVKPSDTQIPENFAVKFRTNVDNVPETIMTRPWWASFCHFRQALAHFLIK